MIAINTVMMTEPNDSVEKKEINTKTNIALKCRDFTCGIIFIVYMLANLVMCGASIFNGNFENISKVANSTGDSCGTGGNKGYPYLYYPTPCQGRLDVKICVEKCPSNVDQMNYYYSLNTSTPDHCWMTTYDPYLYCDTDCSVYNTYPYIQKICVPSDPNNAVIPLIQSADTQIVLNNIAVSHKEILYLSAVTIVVALIAYFIQIIFPSIIYLYITIVFVCILLLAFLILKLTQIRKDSLSEALRNSPLIMADEEKQQIVSYILFSIYFISLPLVMLIKDKLKKILTIMRSLVYFLFTSVGIHLFNFATILILYIQFSFEVFVLVNYFSNGKVTDSPLPFRVYSKGIVNPASLTFFLIGFVWLISFTISFHKFIICSYTYFWFREEQENGPTFQPLQRSFNKAYYNFGSICTDAILWPLNFLVTLIYSFTNPHLGQSVQEQTNKCVTFMYDIKAKINKCIEGTYKYFNQGGFCDMVINNNNYFRSNQEAADLHLEHYSKYFGFGMMLFIYNMLFIVIVSLLISYFVLYFNFISEQEPPAMSSLIVPLIIVFLFALTAATVMGNTLGYGLDTMVMCTMAGSMKPGSERYVFEVTKIIEDV